MPEVSLAEWKKFLHGKPQAHVLQTGEWGELKSAFDWGAARMVVGNSGAQILFRKLPLGFTFAYVPKGPVLETDSTALNEGFWAELDNLCKHRRSIFCKIELDAWEDGQFIPALDSFSHLSQYNVQPPRTIVVDIGGSEEQILARMKQKTRYNIRLAAKKGVTVRSWDDIPGFYRMMQITGGRDNFGVHSLDYYRRAYELFHPQGAAELLLAEFEGRPLAALMVFTRGNRAWYMYGASTDEERNLMPAYLLQWEAMRWARARGAWEYDLWGVPDEDEPTLEGGFETRQDGLWGVYRFKRGFGGTLKRSVQAQDRVYRPLLYKLYLRRMAGRGNA
jgi:lipid II:glycine glycyltransferase (peptidoglycan interpeptide bridge formation enzyme)